MPRRTECPFEKFIYDAVKTAVREVAQKLAAPVEKRMLSTKRVLVYLDVERSTLEALVDRGKLHRVRYRNGGAYYYQIAELDRLLASGCVEGDV